MIADGANHSRFTSITYPNGKVLNYNYASGLDDAISRLSSLSDNSGTLESYSYLGLGMVVKRSHPLPTPTPSLDLTYVTPGSTGSDSQDQYTGLDRFDRVIDQKWQVANATPTVTDEFKYGYDRDSNRLYRTNEVNHSWDELYYANGVVHADLNCLSAIQFAVDVLHVGHIIVCGHYGCGGVLAALRDDRLGLTDNWLRHVQDVQSKHRMQLLSLESEAQRHDRLCELNVIEQVVNVSQTTVVREAWARGQALAVHGWIYKLTDGLLRDLGMCVSAETELAGCYETALAEAAALDQGRRFDFGQSEK